jgi:hypothetical protein
MVIIIQAFPLFYPGTLLSLTYRHDFYLHSTQRLVGPVRIAGAAVAIPVSSPEFSSPLFNAGLVALGIGLCFLRALPLFVDIPPVMCSMMGVYLTVPVVIVAIAGKAWVNGALREWWIYEEVYVVTSPCPSILPLRLRHSDVVSFTGADHI